MEVRYTTQFDRELRRIRNIELRRRVEQLIEELKSASTIVEVRNAAKMTGSDRHYRIRVGDYRLGLEVDGTTAILLRIGHRREIYRYFK